MPIESLTSEHSPPEATADTMPKTDLPHLTRAMRERHEDRAGLPDRTYFHYRAGNWPPVVVWLSENPDLALALARDALDRRDAAGSGENPDE